MRCHSPLLHFGTRWRHTVVPHGKVNVDVSRRRLGFRYGCRPYANDRKLLDLLLAEITDFRNEVCQEGFVSHQLAVGRSP